ncbi:putative GH43/DUF377 family glycosyl hydrolase [Mobilisporobacter senegalensis]|uniref:Putative GH43/DUF377 family glycosyl hydrolase n=1 Tax=Mobilisporobacter senegalensis TaxID=1329262 RepID=A0A3N1X341_9FIRM|nr:glycoside hydrolase family 130 protein [Mobilisporobacter senegalensis]ROR21220.1 putative GH43/DUF377 family glycosyl hydrolase [Mobilisporobacter senegalensis]
MKEQTIIINDTNIARCENNPLLTPDMVKPSCEGFIVKGVFNCGVAKYKEEYILLCRVAEAVKSDSEDVVKFPVIVNEDGKSCFKTITLIKSENSELCFDDSRTITRGKDGNSNVVYLTTLSHLRIARSKDGVHFTIDEHPTIMPNAENECWGMEDPRITRIDDTYYINYTAVSPYGAETALITTKDFGNFTREGCIFLPENKDVTIFPEKINGKYYAFNRPVPKAIGTPDIWLSESNDLIHWGKHQHFYGVSDTGWENGRIGGGAPPIKTEKGWIKIYHAADRNSRYCLGVFLLDLENPDKILAKSEKPLLEPEEYYEKNGFFGEVVFTCGCLYEDNKVIIYYGAADDTICRADISLEELYSHLGIGEQS